MLNRKIIRKSLISKIKTHTPFSSMNIFDNRRMPATDKQLPAIYIFTENESIEEYASTPKSSKRELEVTIEYINRGKLSDLEDELDDFLYNLENIMNFDRWLTINGVKTLEDCQITSTQTNITKETGNPMLHIQANYKVIYVTEDISDLDIITDLNTIYGQTKIENKIVEDEIDFSI